MKKKQTLKLKPTYASETNSILNYNHTRKKKELILITFKHGTFKPIVKYSLRIKVIIAKNIESNLEVSLLVVGLM